MDTGTFASMSDSGMFDPISGGSGGSGGCSNSGCLLLILLILLGIFGPLLYTSFNLYYDVTKDPETPHNYSVHYFEFPKVIKKEKVRYQPGVDAFTEYEKTVYYVEVYDDGCVYYRRNSQYWEGKYETCKARYYIRNVAPEGVEFPNKYPFTRGPLDYYTPHDYLYREDCEEVFDKVP